MPTPMKPVLYSYIRFSTVEQSEGHSLNRQMSYAKEIAQEKGLELDESLTMKDLGLSAYHKKNITHGALGVFLKAIEDGKVPPGSILVIESLDRISRAAAYESQAIIAQIINADITVITAADKKEYSKESLSDNSMDLLYIILVLIRANEESATKSKRVTSALLEQCKRWQSGERGFRVKCGKPPKWVEWSDEKKEFVFVQREAEIMLRKIELFKQGYGGLKIAECLNDEFGAGTVHHTGANVYKEIKRRTLVGEFNVTVGGNEFVLRGYYPALISQDEFDLLVADSTNRGAIKHSQKFVGILSGIDVFKCATCGNSVGSHVIYRKKKLADVKSSHKRYGCVEARRNNSCDMKPTVQIEVVENAVAKYCQDQVNLQRILLGGTEIDSILQEQASLKVRLSEVEAKIDRLTETLVMLGEESPKAIARKIRALENEADDLNDRLAVNKNKRAKVENSSRDDVSDRWLSLTKDLAQLNGDKRLEIRQLVKDTFKSIRLHSTVDKCHRTNGLDSLIESELLGGVVANCFELTLEFYNGKKRLLRVDKHSGDLLAGVELR